VILRKRFLRRERIGASRAMVRVTYDAIIARWLTVMPNCPTPQKGAILNGISG